MNRTKVSTYFRLGSQQDAGRRELSSTAPWSQQSNQNSPFASKEGEVNGFNPQLKLSQLNHDELEDDIQVEEYEADFEDEHYSSKSVATNSSTIEGSRDRNGTTPDHLENLIPAVSVYGHRQSGSEDEYSLADLTEFSRAFSHDHIGVEEPLSNNLLPVNKKLFLAKRPVDPQTNNPAEVYQQYLNSKRTANANLAEENNLRDNITLDRRTYQGSTNVSNTNSQEIDDLNHFDDKQEQVADYNNGNSYNLQHEPKSYNTSEDNPLDQEPKGFSISRDNIKVCSDSTFDKTMRQEELGYDKRTNLSHRLVPSNTSTTTGEAKVTRTTSRSGHQTTSFCESRSLRPSSSQGNGSSFPMSRDLEHEYLEERNNKSSLPTDTRTTDRGSRIGKDKPRYRADVVLDSTSTSEAFQLFAKSRLIGLVEQRDLLTASMTQRKIKNPNDLNKTVDEENHLRRLSYFGLTPIADPPLHDPLVEILDIRSVQLHASNMVVTSEIYSEHKRLYDRTQYSELQAPAFALLFQRVGKVVKLLEDEITSCTNKYRTSLFVYLSEILEGYNQYGVQVVSYLPNDWEVFSLNVQRYYLIILKERYFAEATQCLSDLNSTHEVEMTSLLDHEGLIHEHIGDKDDVEQNDDLSVSSEMALDFYAGLTNPKTNIADLGRNNTYYDPRLTHPHALSTKGASKLITLSNKQVRTPERKVHESVQSLSPLGSEKSRSDEKAPVIELIDPLKVNYDTEELDELDDNYSRTSTTGRNGLPSRDKAGVVFSKSALYAKRDEIVLGYQHKLGFNDHQREAMLSGGVGSTTLNNLDWTSRMSKFRNYQLGVNIVYIEGTNKLDYERFLKDSAMRARNLQLSTKELCILFKETGMGPSKETTMSLLWATKYPTIVSRVLNNVNWELGTDTAEEWLYWELLWNKIRIEIVTLGIAKKNDNTLADRLENVHFTRTINLESPNDIENLDKLTTWIDKLTSIYRTSNQSKTGYSYLWHFILRKLTVVNCPYIMVWTKFLKSQMHKAMTLTGLTSHDRQRLFGTTEGKEREEDCLQKDDFEWAFECLRTSHINSILDYSLAVVCIKTDIKTAQITSRERNRSTAPSPPPLAQGNKQRRVNSATTHGDVTMDMYEGKDGKSLNAVEKNLRKEIYLLTQSIPILNLLKDKSPEATAKAIKFREFLTKHNLSICGCGLMKETPQCNENCVIIVNKELKVGNFVQFLKNKSQRLGRKFDEKEVLQHLQYIQRNLKWDDAKLQAYHKSVLEKWSPINLAPAAVTKVLNVLSNIGSSYHQMDSEGEEEEVSYGETDSSHF